MNMRFISGSWDPGNNEGKFGSSVVPLGSYTINAQAPGIAATQNVEITAGSVAD